MYPTNNVSIPLTDAVPRVVKHVPYKQCFKPGGGAASVRGIETLFVGYMFHTPGGGAASVRGTPETLFVGYMFHNPGL